MTGVYIIYTVFRRRSHIMTFSDGYHHDLALAQTPGTMYTGREKNLENGVIS